MKKQKTKNSATAGTSSPFTPDSINLGESDASLGLKYVDLERPLNWKES